MNRNALTGLKRRTRSSEQQQQKRSGFGSHVEKSQLSHCFVCISMIDQKKQEAEIAKQREAEKAARSYDSLFNVEEDEIAPQKYGRELEDDFM